MVLVKNWLFFLIFILRKIGQKSNFYVIVEWRNAFLDYKNKILKKSRNWDFSKGVSPWFLSKTGNFSRFKILGKIGQKNVFYDILEGGNAFLDYKNKKLKQSKNLEFSKGVSWWLRSIICNISRFLF